MIECLRVRKDSLLPLRLDANQGRREQATLPNPEILDLAPNIDGGLTLNRTYK